MAAAAEKPSKSKLNKGKPWSRLANAMVQIGKDPVEADQLSWHMWFECKCPKTSEALKDNKDALIELYEQSTGNVVSDEDEEEEDEEETPESK